MPYKLTRATIPPARARMNYRDRLVNLLDQDLDFHDQASNYASHNFHSFPAKFPPQLPRKFIATLTGPGDTVLDPMLGSGTTILEALLANRRAIGFDIDPLAVMLARVKCANLGVERVADVGKRILARATASARKNSRTLATELDRRWDGKTRQFVNYWFAPETQIELLALMTEIEQIPDLCLREFFQVTFSSIIITKSGGVSLAFDLAHTRPHRAKVVTTKSGEILLGHDFVGSPSHRVKLLTKTLRSPLEEFDKRLQRNIKGLLAYTPDMIPPDILFGNAQRLPLSEASVDLVITSPPYISNAIDYMRAHKFSLVWMGYSVSALGQKRRDYIGAESISGIEFEDLAGVAAQVVADIRKRDVKKGQVVHRYYSEMTRTFREMYRVLKPNAALVVVVGASVVKGVDTRISQCLIDIGKAIGFDVPKVAVRNLDRNRRMLPASAKLNLRSQIQKRMHKEYVIGFYKPRRQ